MSTCETFNSKEHSHRRYNPLMDEYVLVCPHRLKRPWKGQQEEENSSDEEDGTKILNSLAPGGTRSNGTVNPMYENMFVFDNDFPALVVDGVSPSEDTDKGSIENFLFNSQSAKGECKVMCFHAHSAKRISMMTLAEITNIVDEWITTQRQLDDRWTYVQIFENKGAMMGCSNEHPHCQIWASSYVPNVIVVKNSSMKRFSDLHNKKNMLVEYLRMELIKKERIVFETEKWAWLVPYWAVWPYETMLLPKRHVRSICELDTDERQDLALMMKKLLTCYDNLFNTSFPYTMGWHGCPNPSSDYDHWQLHACYYPPLVRSKTVKKFMVGYEMLAMPQRDFTAETAAETLRNLPSSHYKDV